jgi:hypothetical protein
MVGQCIYCRGNDDWADEHVLSKWMGCRTRLPDSVCITCNHHFGAGPEGRLHTLLVPIAEVCAVPQGESKRRNRVWKTEVHGQVRRLMVSADRKAASLTQPVVREFPLGDGRTLLTVTGDEAQDATVRSRYRRKGRPLTSVASTDHSDELDAYFEIDFEQIYSGEALTAASKYAGNYACFAFGQTSPCFAFTRNAYDALRGTQEPAAFVFPVGDDQLLNMLVRCPPHHTCLIAPSDRAATWVAVVVLFGLFPFFVVAPDVDTKLEYWKCHRFLVGKGAPTVEEVSSVGLPNIRLADVTVRDAAEWRQRLIFLGQNYKRFLPLIAKELTGREIRMERTREGSP